MKTNRILWTVVTAALVAGITSFAMDRVCAGRTIAPEASDWDGNSFRTVNLTDTDYPDLTYAAESAVDAVVYVKVTETVKNPYGNIDPLLRYFFGFGDGAPQERSGSGSGVIIRPDGYIVTNNHVVVNASKIEVTMNTGQSYPARLIGTDPVTDVAIIKVEAENLPTVPMGDSENLRLGEWVLAIGSPLGYELRGTITAGIVSAKGRSMPPRDGEFKIESFIQTDAAVNPGNSGGALVNKAGELVGINTAIVSQTGAYSGYSFAVPVNIVRRIVADLIDYGEVKRAVLGVKMSTNTKKIADEMKHSATNGVYINEILAGGAAEKAGLREGDIILSVDSTRIKTSAALQEKVNSYHPGDKAVFTVERDGKDRRMEVVFQGVGDDTGTVAEDGSVVFYGARLRTASKETLRMHGLRSGVEIVSVGEGKMKDAGAVEGFIIRYLNDESVREARDVIALAKKSRRAVFIEGVTAEGRPAYFGFGKAE